MPRQGVVELFGDGVEFRQLGPGDRGEVVVLVVVADLRARVARAESVRKGRRESGTRRARRRVEVS